MSQTKRWGEEERRGAGGRGGAGERELRLSSYSPATSAVCVDGHDFMKNAVSWNSYAVIGACELDLAVAGEIMIKWRLS